MMKMQKNTVLVVAAHPDDETLGCYGTLCLHKENNDNIYIIFLTNGVSARIRSKNESARIRKKNALKALSVIGLKEKNIFFLNYPDNRTDSVALLSIIKEIEKIKSEIKPNIVYTHFSNDLNIDHRVAFNATITACRPWDGETVKKILCFETLSSTEWSDQNKTSFKPNYFIDISKFIGKKIKALKCYKSEIRKSPNARSLENVKNLSKYRGNTIGVKYAEAFYIERIISKNE